MEALAIAASWPPLPQPGVTYEIVRTDQSPARTLGETDHTSYVVDGLAPGERVCLVVRARNASGTGAGSSPACAAALDIPRAPAAVTAYGVASGVRVEWEAGGGAPVSKWIIAAGQQLLALDASARAADLGGLSAGVDYEIRVFAENAAGRSAPASAHAKLGPPKPPRPPARAWVEGPEIPLYVNGAFAAADRLWVVGSDGSGTRMLSAKLDPDGAPIAWENISSRSPIFFSSSYPVWTDGTSWRVVGVGPGRGWGMAPSTGTTQSALLSSDAASVVWTLHDEFPAGGYGTGAAISGNHVYAVGGQWWSGGSYTGYGASLPLVHVADLAEDGSPGAWRHTASLPVPGPTWAASVDGAIYALVQSVWAGPRLFLAIPASDGHIVQWRATAAQPPAGSALTALVVASGHLYMTDGTEIWVGSRAPDGDVLQWSASPVDRLPDAQLLVAAGSHLYAFSSLSSWQPRYAVYVATADPSTGHLTSDAPPQSPGVPLSLKADSPSAGAVRISWAAPSGTVTGYEVRVAGTTNVRASLPSDARAYTASSLDPLQWTALEVRAVNAIGAGPWARTDAVTPWPSSTWLPVFAAESESRCAYMAGNTIFDFGDPISRVIPLDESGRPWGYIGPDWVRDHSPYLMHEASASVTVSDQAACMYVTGGQQGFNNPALSDVGIWCAQDDGFLGLPLPGQATHPPPPMAIARLNHASVALGGRVYVLGGAQQDASGTITLLSDVSSAPIGPDWNTGAWQSTTPLPFAARDVAAVAAQGRIYVVAPAPGQVRILLSEVGADGSLGAWRETLGIAEDRDGPSAAIVGDFLYVLGGGQQSQASVVIGHLDPQAGDVLSWSADPADSLVGQPKRPAVLARGNRLYVLGGSTAPGQMADIDLKTGHFSSWR